MPDPHVIANTVVADLKTLLEKRPDLKSALEVSITKADLPKLFTDLTSFYEFIAAAVIQVPQDSNQMLEMDLAYYYVVSISPDEILVTDPDFQKWNVAFNTAWGEFINTDASKEHLGGYIDDPRFTIEDYQDAPSGWHTFNQFFARQTKPGKRPVAESCDSTVVVSPCDFVIKDIVPITADSQVTVKHVTLPVSELLQDSEYSDAFAGGYMLSGFLQIFDYHRFHTPIGGKVVEAKKIPGYVGITIEREGDMLIPIPKPGFQFAQDRALVVLDSPHMGLVGILPVGMAQISSVVISTFVGAELHKGEELGYFQFGGSNVLMLSQKGRFSPGDGVTDRHILQGMAIGKSNAAK